MKKKTNALFEQLILLQEMGLSLLQSFELLINAPKPCLPLPVLKAIYSQLCKGTPLHECFKDYQRYFSPLTLAFLNIANDSGRFFEVMQLLFSHERRMQNFKQKIKQQLSYPALLILLMILLLVFFYQHLLPQYLDLMNQLSVPIPGMLIKITQIKRFFPVLFLILICGLIFYQSIINQLSIKQQYDWWLWTSTMEICLQASISWLTALAIIADNFPHLHQAPWIKKIQRLLRLGASIEECFIDAPLIMQQYLPLLKKSPQSQVVFAKITAYFSYEIDLSLQKVELYLQPVLLLVISSLAGCMIWLMYQPLLAISQNI